MTDLVFYILMTSINDFLYFKPTRIEFTNSFLFGHILSIEFWAVDSLNLHNVIPVKGHDVISSRLLLRHRHCGCGELLYSTTFIIIGVKSNHLTSSKILNMTIP